ncbi:hypothetical protein CF326_g1074, partial [Tilletia indica]
SGASSSEEDSSNSSAAAKYESKPSWTFLKCKARLILTSFDDADVGLFEHQNNHHHGHPDTRRPRPSEKKALKEVVLAHPSIKPKGLSMGLAKAGAGQMKTIPTARDISSTFVNLSRLAYHRVDILNEGGIRPRDGHRDGPILEFISMQGDGNPGTGVAVRVADVRKSQFKVIIQTDWQRDVFLDRHGDFGGVAGSGEAKKGGSHAGVLTDVTFSVFKDFYLCGSSVFSHSLGRWVPILWSIFQNQREIDFAAHFDYLWQTIDDASLSDDAAQALMAGVVDFSQAQLNGFKKSFRTWALRRKRLTDLSAVALAAECKVLDEMAQKLLKGCGFHFLQSAERVKKNGSFVQTELRSRFEELLKSLRAAKTVASFDKIMQNLEKEFPKCIEWLHWWVRCDISSLVFPAHRVMEQQQWDQMPTTTSPLESLHALYYLSWERKMDLHSGADSLQRLAELMQAEYEAEEGGIATRYGVQQASTRKAKARRARYLNDGRAPDVPAVKKKESTAKRDQTDDADALNEQTKKKYKVSDVSSSVPSTATTTTTTAKSTATKTTPPSVLAPAHDQLQSYPHDSNTCYITSTLECLWAAWLFAREDWLELRGLMLAGGGVDTITKSMLQRELAYKCKTPKAVYNGLVKARSMVAEWVVGKERLWAEGEFGSWEWLGHAIALEPSYQVQAFFSVGTQTTRSCTYHHVRNTIPSFGQSIELDLRRDHADDLQAALDRWLHTTQQTKCEFRLPDGLGNCGHPSVIGRLCYNWPRILALDMGRQTKEEELWSLAPLLNIGEITYGLVGRICATSESGFHFTALVHLRSHESNPRPEGTYSFDDMRPNRQGLATLIHRSTTSDTQNPAPNPLTTAKFYSLIAFYIRSDYITPNIGPHQPVAEYKLTKDLKTTQSRQELLVANGSRVFGQRPRQPSSSITI